VSPPWSVTPTPTDEIPLYGRSYTLLFDRGVVGVAGQDAERSIVDFATLVTTLLLTRVFL